MPKNSERSSGSVPFFSCSFSLLAALHDSQKKSSSIYSIVIPPKYYKIWNKSHTFIAQTRFDPLDSTKKCCNFPKESYFFTGPMGQMTQPPSVWYYGYYFLFIKSCKILCKNPFNIFLHFFLQNYKNENKKVLSAVSLKVIMKSNT